MRDVSVQRWETWLVGTKVIFIECEATLAAALDVEEAIIESEEEDEAPAEEKEDTRIQAEAGAEEEEEITAYDDRKGMGEATMMSPGRASSEEVAMQEDPAPEGDMMIIEDSEIEEGTRDTGNRTRGTKMRTRTRVSTIRYLSGW